MKHCIKQSCKQKNPQTYDNFYGSKISKDGFVNTCKHCVKEYSNLHYKHNIKSHKNTQKQYRQANKDKLKKSNKIYRDANPITETQKLQHNNSRLIRQYGIDLTKYNQMDLDQQGLCAICKRHKSNFKKSLSIDHDHKTKKIRDLLCQPCNALVGIFETKPDLILAVRYYIERHSKSP